MSWLPEFSGWSWSLDGWIVLAGVLSACSCALIGSFLVLRRMSLMGDAISHAVLPGLAIAFIVTGSRSSWAMFVGAVVVGVVTALLTQLITRYGKVETGAAMGVVFSVLFALGLILIRRAADHVDLDPGCVLYGNVVQVPLDALGGGIPPVIRNLVIVLAANLLFVALFYKELKITSFDPELADTLGIPSSLMHYALMVMVAVTTVANFEAVGSILVIAMLIVPAVTAGLFTDRLILVLVIGQVLAALSAIIGHPLAVYGPGWLGHDISVNSAAMMAVVAGGLLGLAVLLAPNHGLIPRGVARVRLSLRIVRQDILGLLYRWGESQPAAPAMPREELLHAVGGGWAARVALTFLELRRGVYKSVERSGEGREISYGLTSTGSTEALKLIGGHRLWETYLAKNWALAPDHLHAPAERMEHFITPDIRERLREELTDPEADPHGQRIPPGGELT